MLYNKFLIECDYIYNSGMVLSALEYMEGTHEVTYITGNIVCVDTCETFEYLYKNLVVRLDLTLGITPIDENNFDEVMYSYNKIIKKQVSDFIKECDISEDINYFLDLIIDEGGIKNLTPKEKQRLKELSNK